MYTAYSIGLGVGIAVGVVSTSMFMIFIIITVKYKQLRGKQLLAAKWSILIFLLGERKRKVSMKTNVAYEVHSGRISSTNMQTMTPLYEICH